MSLPFIKISLYHLIRADATTVAKGRGRHAKSALDEKGPYPIEMADN